MDINFKEYFVMSLQIRRNEIAEHKNMLSRIDRIEDRDKRIEKIKELRESIRYEECLLSAEESILKQL